MTPDELKRYVDTALQQQKADELLYMVGAAVISLFIVFIVSYFREKGKNVATKEDVGRITTEVEKSKAFYAERIEELKTDLNVRAHYGKVRYEREMKIYEDIWPKLIHLRVTGLSLRPAAGYSLASGETMESRKEQRSETFSTALVVYGHLRLNRSQERPE